MAMGTLPFIGCDWLCLWFKSAATDFFEHLDAREWSLSSAQSEQIQRVSVSHIIDHQLYIVVYFQHFRAKPLLIWMDQLPRQQWKALKKLAKLI